MKQNIDGAFLNKVRR